MTTVFAPIAGIVTERAANTGLNVDTTAKLFRVVDLSTVWVVADRLREGLLARPRRCEFARHDEGVSGCRPAWNGQLHRSASESRDQDREGARRGGQSQTGTSTRNVCRRDHRG